MSTTGYIGEDGRYHRGEEKHLGHDVSSTHKDWSHQQQRKEYGAEITQPHLRGKPNRKFIETYPDIAKEYWSQEVIDKTLREQL